MAGAKVFISYCHEDGEFLERLRRHLGMLESQFAVEIWDDRRIGAGEDWRQSIETAISSSDLYVCLISVDFFASEFIRDHEIPVILKAVESGKPLLPIRVGPLGVDGHPICCLQSLNEPNRPLIDMDRPEQEAFFAQATKTMWEALQSIVDTPPFEGARALTTTEPVEVGAMAEQQTGYLNVAAEDSPGAYNIAVIGQTGVGKSELVNYLFGQPLRKTGVGKPVTEPGFHKQSFELKGVRGNLFDSWGLEVGKHEEWQRELGKELSERGTDKPADQWFHTVIFCIHAKSSRAQPFEVGIVQTLLDQKYAVIVVLTHCDVTSKSKREQLWDEIRSEIGAEISCVEVCSKEEELPIGTTQKFGAEQLAEQMFVCFWDSIAQRLPGRCVFRVAQEMDAWLKKAKSYLDNETGWFNHLVVEKNVQKDLENLCNGILCSGGRFDKILREELQFLEEICFNLKDARFLFGSSFSESIYQESGRSSATTGYAKAIGIPMSVMLAAPGVWGVPIAALVGAIRLPQQTRQFKADMLARLTQAVQETKQALHQMEPELTKYLRENIPAPKQS